MWTRAALSFSSVRSLSKIEFLELRRSGQKKTAEASAPVASRKRVQRYGNFLNWQNISGLFLRKMKKKGEKGQNGGGFEEELEKNGAERGEMGREEGRDENAIYKTP